MNVLPQRPLPPPVRVIKRKNVPKRLPRSTFKHGQVGRGRGLRAATSKVRKELSAGGVAVRSENNQYLVALLRTEHRKGLVWVLPKGHVETAINERVSEAARREVMEEAGLSDLSVKQQLGVTRFRFQAEDVVVHKTVHYFLMTTNQKQLTPQLDEDIVEAKWFPIDEAITILEYDTDQDMVQRAKAELTGVPYRKQRIDTRRPRRNTNSNGRKIRIRV